MSIGVLGFVVWSQWLAFLKGDYEVINSTVGWNGLLFSFLFFFFIIDKDQITELGNLLDTFCSLNANKSAQSAGNSNSRPTITSTTTRPTTMGDGGSSETIRGNTYDLFLKNFSYFFKKDFSKDNNWLSWFIGFLEGDGAILEHKGRCCFVLTQKDDTVLHEIHETLNIGKVKHFYDNKGNRKYSRFIISENKGIFLLYLLLNGNLVLQHRVNQLNKWNIALNNASRFDYSLFSIDELPYSIDSTKEPTLNDAWLSGFTDAEGCFSIKIANEKKAFYVQLLFILDQKNAEFILNKIALLFSKSHKAIPRTPNINLKNTHGVEKVKGDKENEIFRLTLPCNGKNKIISSKIINYFNCYNLKTTKKESFSIWTEIFKIVVNNQPLSLETLKVVRKLRHNMNYFTIENLSKGYSNKS